MSRVKPASYLQAVEAGLQVREAWAAQVELEDPERAARLRAQNAADRAKLQQHREVLEVLWDLAVTARAAGLNLDEIGEQITRAYLEAGQPQGMADRILDVLREQRNGRGVNWILEQIRPMGPDGRRIQISGTRWGPRTVERTLTELENMGKVKRREWLPKLSDRPKTLWYLPEYNPVLEEARRQSSGRLRRA